MAKRERGRPTNWVSASIAEHIQVGRPGLKIEVWRKWKRKRKKLGTLLVSVGGLRWRPHKGQLYRQRNWLRVAEWLQE